MDIAILLYDGVAALDAVGPYEVLHIAPDVQVEFVATKAGLIRTDLGMLRLNADYSLADVPTPDIVLVPGAIDPEVASRDEAILAWLRRAHESSTWTTSVCTGALVLGAAGLLEGKLACTHWMAMDALAQFGARPSPKRVVRDGKLVTSAGVSAGIDMALRLVADQWDEATAQEIQLLLEYAPDPPFSAGSPATVPAALRERVIAKYGGGLRA